MPHIRRKERGIVTIMSITHVDFIETKTPPGESIDFGEFCSRRKPKTFF